MNLSHLFSSAVWFVAALAGGLGDQVAEHGYTGQQAEGKLQQLEVVEVPDVGEQQAGGEEEERSQQQLPGSQGQHAVRLLIQVREARNSQEGPHL